MIVIPDLKQYFHTSMHRPHFSRFGWGWGEPYVGWIRIMFFGGFYEEEGLCGCLSLLSGPFMFAPVGGGPGGRDRQGKV
jgi:hypothetical protein